MRRLAGTKVPLAAERRLVSGHLHRLAQRDHVLPQQPALAAARIEAGQDRRPRCGALGVVVKLGEPHPLRREAVEARRADLAPIAADVTPAHIVAHDQHDVRPLHRLGQATRLSRTENQRQQEAHGREGKIGYTHRRERSAPGQAQPVFCQINRPDACLALGQVLLSCPHEQPDIPPLYCNDPVICPGLLRTIPRTGPVPLAQATRRALARLGTGRFPAQEPEIPTDLRAQTFPWSGDLGRPVSRLLKLLYPPDRESGEIKARI